MEIFFQVNDVEDLENYNFAFPGELHDVNRRDSSRRNRKIKIKKKFKKRQY